MASLMKRIAASVLVLSLAGVLAAQAAPQGPKPPRSPAGGPPQGNPAANYTIEQSVSD